MALTSAGKLYAEFCRDVLRREENFRLELEKTKQAVEGSVHVASIYSIGISEMTRVKAEFAARYPNAALHVEYMRPDKIYEAVLTDEADLGLVSYPAASRELIAIPWRDEVMAAAAPLHHPLAGRTELDAPDLAGQDFVGFDEDLTIRHELDRFLREHGVSVNTTMHFDNIQMIKEAVALGSGISILPVLTMRAEIEQGRLVAIPLRAPGLVRPVGIIHRRRRKLNRAAQSLLNLLLEA